jgi:hypothetical protein
LRHRREVAGRSGSAALLLNGKRASDLPDQCAVNAPGLAADRELICGCVVGAAPAPQIEEWLAEAGFTDIRVTVRADSRDLVASWAPGRGVEYHAAAAVIEARKPTG